MQNGLPDRIFFTGVPGSKWSGIAQVIEQLDGMNTSDRTPERQYKHSQFSGHLGAYFGKNMEFPASLDKDILDSAHSINKSCRLIKSHEWSYMLDHIKKSYPKDWILLVYREDQIAYDWWKQAGGYDISYPNYSAYVGTMTEHIKEQNFHIKQFAKKYNLKWEKFTSEWVNKTFKQNLEFENNWNDVKVAIWKFDNL